jgi:immune inhibitor A
MIDLSVGGGFVGLLRRGCGMGRSVDDFDVVGCLRVLAGVDPDRCSVAPSPELRERLDAAVERMRSDDEASELAGRVKLAQPKSPGLNDGVIIPGSYFPLGTSIDRVRSAAADRAPLHGTLRVIVVLVDFSDQEMAETTQHFEELFFSTGVLPNGSVKEYFDEVTNGLVTITGQVVGPYRLPRTLAEYAHGESGTGMAAPNARTMARDAAVAADPHVNFGPYDNDGNGFVDAFIVVHAGPGAEQTGSTGHIWSHKWVLSGGEYVTDTTKIFAYLTVPEDARIGVCAHELGHLLFGFPDLYDTDNTSEGIGNWCLMAGGSWNGGGDVPAHPSAWCKAQQAWVTVQNVTANATLTIADVKDSNTVYRLWKDGAPGQEYFLLENRQKVRYDAQLPGDGLLIWHLDDAIANNTDEAHYRVALAQADGLRNLEGNANRGDAGDAFPGSSDNRAFTNTSNPHSKSYGGLSTCVSVTAISDSGPVMTAMVQVRCGKAIRKDLKDVKDGRKDVVKEKDFKDQIKDRKEKDLKDGLKELRDKDQPDKRPDKPEIDKAAGFDKNFDDKFTDGKFTDGKLTDGKLPDGKLTDGKLADGFDRPVGARGADTASLEARLAALEEALYGGAEPFIGSDLRPDLRDSALGDEQDLGGGIVDKRSYDSKPPELG